MHVAAGVERFVVVADSSYFHAARGGGDHGFRDAIVSHGENTDFDSGSNFSQQFLNAKSAVVARAEVDFADDLARLIRRRTFGLKQNSGGSRSTWRPASW